MGFAKEHPHAAQSLNEYRQYVATGSLEHEHALMAHLQPSVTAGSPQRMNPHVAVLADQYLPAAWLASHQAGIAHAHQRLV